MRIFGLDISRAKKSGNGRRRIRRGYDAAKIDRLTADWPSMTRSADADVAGQLRILRARARHTAQNDDYGKRFLKLCRTNVIGAHGIGLQVRSRDPNGELDAKANAIIEAAFREWGRLGVCTAEGRLSWIDAQNLFVTTLARDGEVLVRHLRGWAGNRFGYAIQFLDPDTLDESYNATLTNGGEIRLGVEYDAIDRVVAYHVLKKHPAGLLHTASHGRERERIPAEDIVHAYDIERARQGRGVTWMAASLKRLKMLAGYEQAELVAARVGASKMGFFIEPEETSIGDDLEEGYTPIMEAEPGTFDRLPEGTEFQSWDPEHPVAAYEPYVQAVLRGAASGLGVSYPSLANDLRRINYSSIRHGAIDERDHWRTVQTFTVEHFNGPIFSAWLNMALTVNAFGSLPYGKLAKFDAPVWRPRGWAWVDPKKEGEGHKEAVKGGFKSLTEVAAESGRDLEEVFDQLAQEKKMAERYGLTLDTINTGGTDA